MEAIAVSVLTGIAHAAGRRCVEVYKAWEKYNALKKVAGEVVDAIDRKIREGSLATADLRRLRRNVFFVEDVMRLLIDRAFPDGLLHLHNDTFSTTLDLHELTWCRTRTFRVRR